VRDRYSIRYWPADIVLSTLASCGLERIADVSERFAATGSRYFICRRSA